jgi:hypothetical protein
VSDVVPLLEVGNGGERISPLLTRRQPCSGPTMPCPGGRRQHVTAGAWAGVMGRRRGGGLWPEMQVPRWAAATTGAGGAEVGAWRAATGRALDASGLGVHQGEVGAASGRSCRCRGVGTPQGTGQSCRSTAAVGGRSSTRFLFRPGLFLGDEANKHALRLVL